VQKKSRMERLGKRILRPDRQLESPNAQGLLSTIAALLLFGVPTRERRNGANLGDVSQCGDRTSSEKKLTATKGGIARTLSPTLIVFAPPEKSIAPRDPNSRCPHSRRSLALNELQALRMNLFVAPYPFGRNKARPLIRIADC
jgi:hypothetical protein